MDWDDYNFEQYDAHDPHTAYDQVKTDNILTANYTDRICGPRSIHALSHRQGGIRSELQAFTVPKLVEWRKTQDWVVESLEQGNCYDRPDGCGKSMYGKEKAESSSTLHHCSAG